MDTQGSPAGGTNGFVEIYSADAVSAYVRRGRADMMIVLFEGAGLVGRGAAAPRRGFIEEADLSVVLVKAHRRNWYPQSVMAPCLDAVRAWCAGMRVVTYGASMGGYAAIKFAAALRAMHVVAVAPQFSIDPACIKLKSDPFVGNYVAGLNAGMDIAAGDVGCVVDILFDPMQENDLEHVSLICRQLDCRLTKITHAGHALEVMFGGGADLFELITACIDGDRPSIEAQVRRRKRLSVFFHMGLYRSVCDRRPNVARWALLQSLLLTPLSSDDHVSRAQALIKLGRADEAACELRARYAVARRDSSRWALASALANVLASMRQTKEAVDWARVAVTHAPDDENVVCRLAQMLLQDGAYEEAETLCTGLRARFDLPAVDFTFGQARAMQGALEEAVPVCLRALGRFPVNAAWRGYVGELLRRVGRDAEARALHVGAVEDVGDAASWLGWSRYLHAHERREDALAAARRAVSLTPSNMPMRSHLSRLLVEAGFAVEALEVGSESIDVWLGGAAGWMQRAWVEEKLGRTVEALASAEQAVAGEAWNADQWAGLLDLAWRLGDQDSARRHCAAADSAGLVATPAYLASRGRVARLVGDLAAAISYLRASVEQWPGNPGTLGVLARYLVDAGQNEEACDVSRRAVELAGDAVWLCMCLIDALERQGRIEEAILACEQAMEADGKSASLPARLAKLLDGAGRSADAGAAIGRAVAAGLDTAELRGTEAKLLFAQGRRAEALDAARRAVEMAPNHPGYLGQLANYLLHDGQATEAAEWAAAAVERAPDAAWLQRLLTQAVKLSGTG